MGARWRHQRRRRRTQSLNFRRSEYPAHQLETVKHRIVFAVAWAELQGTPPRRPAGIPRKRWRRALAQLAAERARTARGLPAVPRRAWMSSRLGWGDAVAVYKQTLRRKIDRQRASRPVMAWSLRQALGHHDCFLNALGDRDDELGGQAFEVAVMRGAEREALVWRIQQHFNGIVADDILTPQRWEALRTGRAHFTPTERQDALDWLEMTEDIPF